MEKAYLQLLPPHYDFYKWESKNYSRYEIEKTRLELTTVTNWELPGCRNILRFIFWVSRKVPAISQVSSQVHVAAQVLGKYKGFWDGQIAGIHCVSCFEWV